MPNLFDMSSRAGLLGADFNPSPPSPWRLATYEPSVKDRAPTRSGDPTAWRQFISTLGVAPQKLVESMVEYAHEDPVGFAADMTPIVGDVKGMLETGDAAAQGKWLEAALIGAGTAVGMIPFVPNVGRAIVRAAEDGGRTAARLPMTVRTQTEELVEALRRRGVGVEKIDHSTNRYGQESSYFDTPAGRIRVSDHSMNQDYATHAIDVPAGERFNAESEADRILDALQRARAQASAARSADEAVTAQFGARYRAAATQQEMDAVLRDYINRDSPTDRWASTSRADRQAMRQRLLSAR